MTTFCVFTRWHEYAWPDFSFRQEASFKYCQLNCGQDVYADNVGEQELPTVFNIIPDFVLSHIVIAIWIMHVYQTSSSVQVSERFGKMPDSWYLRKARWTYCLCPLLCYVQNLAKHCFLSFNPVLPWTRRQVDQLRKLIGFSLVRGSWLTNWSRVDLCLGSLTRLYMLIIVETVPQPYR